MKARPRSSLRWCAWCVVLLMAAGAHANVRGEGNDPPPPGPTPVPDPAAGQHANEAAEAADPNDPALIHSIYRLSDHYPDVSRPLHPQIVEQHGLVRLPSPLTPLQRGEVWDVTGFLRSKGLDLPDNAFARLDTGNRAVALASTAADHRRLEELGETGHSRRPEAAKLTLRVYLLDPDQHPDPSRRELLDAIDRGEEPGLLLLDSEHDTTTGGNLRWSFGSMPADDQPGQGENDPPAAGKVAVHLTTDLRAGAWTTRAEVDFDGWFRLAPDPESVRRRLRWRGFTQGPADEWQAMRATMQDADLLLLLRTVLQHPADQPPLLFSDLFMRPQPHPEPGPPTP